MVSHASTVVAALVDRVLWLDRGGVAPYGHPESVVAAYRAGVGAKRGVHMTERSVLLVSTWRMPPGPAVRDYTAELKRRSTISGCETEIFPIDREELSSFTTADLKDYFARVADAARDHDLVHIQHEHGFFAGPYGYRVSTDVFGSLAGRPARARPSSSRSTAIRLFRRGGGSRCARDCGATHPSPVGA